MFIYRYGWVVAVVTCCITANCAPTDLRLHKTTTGPSFLEAKGLQAELNGLVAVIPAGGPHNEMALRSSRHWRKVQQLNVPSANSELGKQSFP